MKILFTVLGVLLSTATSFAQVRTITASRDQLLNVRTALGIATIIQVPDAIQSAVIGDQSGFKVEYLDKAITIKPLRYAARTNLYLMTEKERFNIRLQTLSQDSADYVVYILSRNTAGPTPWKTLVKSVQVDGITVTINRIASTSSGLLLVDGSLTASRDLAIKPDNFWVFQGNEAKLIDSLFLASLDLRRNKATKFALAIPISGLQSKAPLVLELRFPKTVALKITEREWNR